MIDFAFKALYHVVYSDVSVLYMYRLELNM